MAKTRPPEQRDPGFEVVIQSGGRAVGRELAPRPAPSISPARAEAKARTNRRARLLVLVTALALLSLSAWAWLSNPNTNVPDGALARVNGEYVLERDVTREIELSKVSTELSKRTGAEAPSPGAVLEELIDRKTKVQDAKKARVTVTDAEIDAELSEALKRTGLPQGDLERALERHSLTLNDMRAILSDTHLINKYIAGYVLAGARTDEEKQNKINEWQTNLSQTSKIDRLRPVGTGPAPQVGREAPDFTLNDLNGKSVTLSSLRGRPVMVNFWATWCPPCRAEIPVIAAMYSETHGKRGDYEIVGVATQSDKETVVAFTKEFQMLFPVLPDPESRTTSLYHVLPIPTTFFIDKDGIIRDMRIGQVDRALMEKWLLGPTSRSAPQAP